MMFCQDLVEILSTTKYSKRSHCTLYGYKRNHNGKYKDTKTYDFCKKCNKYVCKDHFECFILRAISSAVVFLFVCLFVWKFVDFWYISITWVNCDFKNVLTSGSFQPRSPKVCPEGAQIFFKFLPSICIMKGINNEKFSPMPFQLQFLEMF